MVINRIWLREMPDGSVQAKGPMGSVREYRGEDARVMRLVLAASIASAVGIYSTARHPSTCEDPSNAI
jgi:hypothetical protein